MSRRLLIVSLLIVTALLTACGGEELVTPAVAPEGWSPEITSCDAGHEAFIRRVMPLLWGRNPASSREVAILDEVAARDGREALIRAMMQTPQFVERMQRRLRDTYLATRAEREDRCEGQPILPTISPALATHVRDNPPDGAPFAQPWNIADLIRSSILLDDMTPWFRAVPFITIGSAIIDVDNLEEERAVRGDYADFFEAAFLNRRMACIGCHNSEFSVTGAADPALDRTWEVPGHFERALYGSPDGRALADLAVFFRITGALSMEEIPEGAQGPPWWQPGPGVSVWGVTEGCNKFIPREEIGPDVLGSSGYLTRAVGPTASVWDLEMMFRSGFDKLRDGLNVDPGGGDVDGEEALAWLTAMAFVEDLWRYATGHRLTTPHSFPRNQAQRDILRHLTEVFVYSGYSLQEVMVAVLMHPWLNTDLARDCSQDTPYFMPPVFDPWVIDDVDPERRGNSIGELIVRRPPWLLVQSATWAMGWEPVSEFYEEDEGVLNDLGAESLFIQEIGITVDTVRGFTESTFGERLAWEGALGTCQPPQVAWDAADTGEPMASPPPDWLDALVAGAGPEHTLEDAVIALKDRLITEPDLSDPAERALVSKLLGAPLDAPVAGAGTEGLRRVCAALLMSPQFILHGAPDPVSRSDATTALVAAGTDRPSLCDGLARELGWGGRYTCDAGGALTPR